MLNVGVNSIFVTLSRALIILLDCLMKWPGPTLRVLLRETGSALDIWLVPYMRLAGVCLSSTGGMAFSTEGPKRGVIEANILSALWLKFAGRSAILLRKPLQPRKTCK